MKIEWKNLTTAQRDALVAEHVMGWQETGRYSKLANAKERWPELSEGEFGMWDGKLYLWPDKEKPSMLRPFSPSTDIAASFQVVEKMSKQSVFEFGLGLQECRWSVNICGSFAFANTPSEAICIAALRAVGLEVEV